MESILTNDNKLKKVKEKYAVIRLLFGAKENNSDIFMWRLIGNSKHLGQVRIESIRKIRKDFCLVPVDGQERIVQDLIGNNSFIDLYIPDSATILRCHVKQSGASSRYYLHFPEFVAQVDRRQSYRLNVHRASEIKISFSKSVVSQQAKTQHFLKDCYDISSDGFSFHISKMEYKFFQINDSITSLEIKMGSWSTKALAEIVAIKEIAPDAYNGLSYKVWRASCRFTQIDQISRKYLEKFIFERIKGELHAINN